MSSRANSREKPRSDPDPKRSRAPVTAGDDEYTRAQLVDIGIAEQAYRKANFATRVAIAFGVCLLLSLLSNAILASKDHTEALVYRDDSKGNRVILGFAGTNTVSKRFAVQNALGTWIQWVRDIPAGDVDLARQNENNARLFVARSSLADTSLQALFAGPQEPLKLVHKQERLVVNEQVNPLTDLTYQVIWSEKETGESGSVTSNTYQGTVTLAHVASAPNDPLLGQVNPAGVFISTYTLQAPGL